MPRVQAQLSEASSNARACSRSAAGTCLAAMLAWDGAAVAQEGENLEALSRDSGPWVVAPKDDASHISSEVDRIHTGNIDRLQLSRSFSIGVDRGREAAPLIVANTMSVVGPHPAYTPGGSTLLVFALPRPEAGNASAQ
jgi:lanthanide-dependent methanol dehydrogenase